MDPPPRQVRVATKEQPWLKIVLETFGLISKPASFERPDKMGSIIENRSTLREFLAVRTPFVILEISLV